MLLEVDIQKQIGAFFCHYAFTVTNDRCGIFGPSGGGKSTLMNMIAGLLTPDRGRIVLDGVTLFDKARKVNLPPERRRVGVVFQETCLFPHMSVGKNLLYGMKRLPKEERHIDLDRVVAFLQIGHLLEQNVRQISGGERQRVALGRSILANPRLVLLDEPLTGLDEPLKQRIIPEIRSILAEFAIPFLFISHNPEEMRLMTEETLVIRGGQIKRQMSTEVAQSDQPVGDASHRNPPGWSAVGRH